jgi:hypothetical protein
VGWLRRRKEGRDRDFCDDPAAMSRVALSLSPASILLGTQERFLREPIPGAANDARLVSRAPTKQELREF